MSAPIDDDAYLEPPNLASDDFGVMEVGDGALPVPVDADVVYDDLEAAPEVIIKSLRPSRGLSVADLDQAFVQQKLLADGAKHWVPVLRSEIRSDAVMVALPYVPRSVQKLISQRLSLKGRQLYEIVLGVLKGLAELKKDAGRPHGNLKPSNILLLSGRIREHKVRLSDPAPTLLAAKRGYGADLYRVGELIHQLVLFRPPRGPDAYPVARSPEWDRIGKAGERWRGLCNFLLNPHTDRARLRVVDVARKLRAIHPRPLFLRPAALTGVTTIFVVGVLVFVREYRQYARNWADLRAAAGWLRPFQAGLVEHRAVLAADDDLREHVLKALDPSSPGHVEMNPVNLAGPGARRLPFESADAPPLQWAAYRRAGAAHAALEQLRADLAPERWKALGTVLKRIPTYEARGSVRLAEWLKNLTVAIESGPSDVTPALLDQLLRARTLLDGIDALRQEAARHESVLQQSVNPPPAVAAVIMAVSRQLREAVAADAPTTDISGAEMLQTRLEIASRRGAKTVATLPQLMDLAGAQEAYEVRGWHAPAQAIGAVIGRFDPDDIATLDAVTAARPMIAQIDARWIAVERRRRLLAGSGDRLLASYGRHIDEALAGPLKDPHLPPLLEQLSRLDAEPEWLAAERFVSSGQWALIDAARFAATSNTYKSFASRLTASTADVAAWLTEAAGPQYRVSPVAVRPVDPTPAMTTGTGQVPVAVVKPPGPVVQTPDPVVKAPDVVAVVPPPVPVAVPKPRLPTVAPAEAKAIVRQKLAVAAGQWTSLRSAVGSQFDAAVGAWRARRAAAAKAQAELLARDAGRLQQLLSQGYTPDEAGEGGTARAVLDSLRSSPAGRKLLEPVEGAVQILETADGPSLRRLASIDDAPLGLRIAAWQKLAAFPTDRTALAQDLATAEELLRAVAAIDPPARRPAVQAAVEKPLRGRWLRFLATAADPQDVAYGLSLQKAFGAIDPATVDEVIRFDLVLAQFRDGMTAGKASPTTAPAAQELAKRLIASAAALPPAVASQPQVVSLVEHLRTARAADGRVDFSQLGPLSPAARQMTGGRISWKAEPAPDGSVVTYRQVSAEDAGGNDASMAFRRIETEAGAFYLCTTETPLGLFSDVITQAAKWNDLKSRKLLWDYDPFGKDPRVGPRVWEWSRSGRRDEGIVRALVWLSPDWLPDGVDHYPETLGREFNRTALRPPPGEQPEAVSPSRRMPMQMVSPAAANYFTALVGCRLPTPAEWKAAYAKEGKPDGANLRDRSWKLELQHLARPGLGGNHRPDAGMFVPTGEPVDDQVWKTPAGADYDDNVLWFREVVPPGGSPLTFQHLAGNVGEFVQDAAGKVYVVGGSALSPPQRPVETAFEVDPATKGYSDVGFRLAFGTPPGVVERLVAALPPPDWYLVHPASDAPKR